MHHYSAYGASQADTFPPKCCTTLSSNLILELPAQDPPSGFHLEFVYLSATSSSCQYHHIGKRNGGRCSGLFEIQNDGSFSQCESCSKFQTSAFVSVTAYERRQLSQTPVSKPVRFIAELSWTNLHGSYTNKCIRTPTRT